ncbi:hypothetical protein C8Q79DRAFT_1011810 [Trametes meyenii]|nr:hypothetical protein C8Q79DRAFT_1011810 [Trametes meyenii]
MAHATYQTPSIAKLPNELLSYIFVLGVHTSDAEDPEILGAPEGSSQEYGMEGDNEDDAESMCGTASSATLPDVFAAVNRHWREVALGTPQLWTRICVTIGDLMQDEEAGLFPAVSRYIPRSGRRPLDVFIDARDPEWDFSESDSSTSAVVSPDFDQAYDYTHPFKAEHMHHVLNLLLPHIVRIRSLAILTDRWAPMRTALECLSFENPEAVSYPSPLPQRLPLLETLVLMRCNEFVSYHPHFSPSYGKGPPHLPFRGLLSVAEQTSTQPPLLPRLRQVVLSGVHLDWSSVPRLLPSSALSDVSGLQRLELSYHCPDVRPTQQELRGILSVCQNLRVLTIRASGWQDTDRPASCNSVDATQPIALRRLQALELGFDDVHSGATLLSAIRCAETRHIVLEDASPPDTGELLTADPILLACAHANLLANSDGDGRPPFPHARSVTLRRVNASAEAFESFYEALPSLRELSVVQMFLLGGSALTRRDVRLIFSPSEVPTRVSVCGPIPVGYEQPQWKAKVRVLGLGETQPVQTNFSTPAPQAFGRSHSIL